LVIYFKGIEKNKTRRRLRIKSDSSHSSDNQAVQEQAADCDSSENQAAPDQAAICDSSENQAAPDQSAPDQPIDQPAPDQSVQDQPPLWKMTESDEEREKDEEADKELQAMLEKAKQAKQNEKRNSSTTEAPATTTASTPAPITAPTPAPIPLKNIKSKIINLDPAESRSAKNKGGGHLKICNHPRPSSYPANLGPVGEIHIDRPKIKNKIVLCPFCLNKYGIEQFQKKHFNECIKKEEKKLETMDAQ
jgi:hypothetical protein